VDEEPVAVAEGRGQSAVAAVDVNDQPAGNPALVENPPGGQSGVFLGACRCGEHQHECRAPKLAPECQTVLHESSLSQLSVVA